MRRILIEHARKRHRIKRGGDPIGVSLDQVDPPSWDEPEAMLALDEALRRLEGQDPRAAEVVQLRYFAGMSIAQTAEALGVSGQTVKREWAFARAWLRRELSGASPSRIRGLQAAGRRLPRRASTPGTATSSSSWPRPPTACSPAPSPSEMSWQSSCRAEGTDDPRRHRPLHFPPPANHRASEETPLDSRRSEPSRQR